MPSTALKNAPSLTMEVEQATTETDADRARIMESLPMLIEGGYSHPGGGWAGLQCEGTERALRILTNVEPESFMRFPELADQVFTQVEFWQNFPSEASRRDALYVLGNLATAVVLQDREEQGRPEYASHLDPMLQMLEDEYRRPRSSAVKSKILETALKFPQDELQSHMAHSVDVLLGKDLDARHADAILDFLNKSYDRLDGAYRTAAGMALHYAQERKDWGKPITDKAAGIIKSLGLSEWAPTPTEATEARHLLHKTGGVHGGY